jgi:hypothetical protein
MPRPEWKRRIFRRTLQALAALSVTLAGLIVWSCYQRATELVHLAVVPFHADPSDSALARAITDSLAGRLGRIRGFTVLPPAAASAFVDSRDSAHAIAQALGVRYVLLGWVRRSPTATAPDRFTIRSWLIDTQDSPPTMGEIVSSLTTDLCPAVAMIAVDVAGHFARAPRGALWGPGGATGCATPSLFDRRDDPTT